MWTHKTVLEIPLIGDNRLTSGQLEIKESFKKEEEKEQTKKNKK